MLVLSVVDNTFYLCENGVYSATMDLCQYCFQQCVTSHEDIMDDKGGGAGVPV